MVSPPSGSKVKDLLIGISQRSDGVGQLISAAFNPPSSASSFLHLTPKANQTPGVVMLGILSSTITFDGATCIGAGRFR